MTSKFSIDNKELLQRISSGEAVVGIDFGNLIVRELAAFRLAAMDSSESVELPLDYLQGHKDGLEWAAKLVEANHPETGDWLYDDPIELAKAIRKGPDMPPAQLAADSEPVAVIDLANLDYLLSGADADVWPPEREEMGDVLLYRHAHQPIVPFGLHPDTQKLVIDFCTALAEKLYKAQLKYGYDADWKQDGWPSQCQAHFHQHIAKGDPRDVAAYCAFMWYHGWKTETAQPAPELQNPISDRQAIVALEGAGAVTPIGRAHKMWCDSCRAAMLAAAQQPPGSEPATVPGKWIPVSERLPDCWCLTCRPVVLNDMRFVVCPDCGNKRCPRANDHRNACTGSNEPGQEGGAYPDTPQEVKP